MDTSTPPASSSPPEHNEVSPSPSTLTDGSDQSTDQLKRRQHETNDGPRSHDQQHVAGKPSRRRRKGSPAEPWVPASLVSFNLYPITGPAPTPLPAVVRTPDGSEERDSYDNTPLQAYHPSCWTGQLVGPSYAPKSEEFSRGRFYGKLLVF